jgi:hypothetical protein
MMLCCCEVNPNSTFQTRSANFKRSQIKQLYELVADDTIGKILSWDYIVKISVININLLMKGVITSKAIKDV